MRRGKADQNTGASWISTAENNWAMKLVSYTRIYNVESDYLSRSVSLRVPLDTRICSLPRAAPGTGRMDGTCWARMDHGRQRKLDLDINKQTHDEKTSDIFFLFSFHLRGGGDKYGERSSV